MAKFQVKKSETSVILTVFIQDSSSILGAGLGSLDESSSIVGGYLKRGGTGIALAVDEDVTTEGTYQAPSAAGKVRIGTPANMLSGTYELHFHNDLFTTADWVTITLGGATNMAPLLIEVQLTSANLNDAVRLGLTALPNAAADAAGGLPISDAGGLDMDAKLAATNEVTAARMGALTDWIDGGRLDLILDGVPLSTWTLDITSQTHTTYPATMLHSVYDAVQAITPRRTTIASLTSQTQFVINSGVVEDDELNDTTAIILGAGGEWCRGRVLSSAAATGEVVLVSDPGIFTIAPGDEVFFMLVPEKAQDPNTGAILTDTNELQTDWVNGGRLDLLLDAIPNAPDAASIVDNSIVTSAKITDIQTISNTLYNDLINGGRLDLIFDAILEDTATTIPGLLSALAAYIDTEVASILEDTGTTIPALIAAIKNQALSELAATTNLPTSPTLEQALMAVYMAYKNKVTQTSSEQKFFNNAGTETFKKAVTDDGATLTWGASQAGT